MLKAGLAEVYRGKAPFGLDINPFLKAEKDAKEARKGVWSLGDKYVSPREWRKIRKTK